MLAGRGRSTFWLMVRVCFTRQGTRLCLCNIWEFLNVAPQIIHLHCFDFEDTLVIKLERVCFSGNLPSSTAMSKLFESLSWKEPFPATRFTFWALFLFGMLSSAHNSVIIKRVENEYAVLFFLIANKLSPPLRINEGFMVSFRMLWHCIFFLS